MPRTGRIGRMGELAVAARLLKNGWNAAMPFVDDEGVDLFTWSEGVSPIPLQVKTSRLTEASQYTFTIRKVTIRPHIVLVLSLGHHFLVLSFPEWIDHMGAKLQTESWEEKGSYTFHIREDLRGWEKYQDDDFQRLEGLGKSVGR